VLLAKMATTADPVSGGRLIVGLEAGWYDPEYQAFGYPTDHRVSRFEEPSASSARCCAASP
jgi:alkanesulfonate monooxygenase SsuD/methylene tetrahydromethanopterin reductase-like flavin-dependent oxidoreductase (luciferase family)